MINTTNKPPPPPAKSPPPRPLVSSALPACTSSAKKSARPSSKRKSVGFCSEQAARKAAIESLPAWTDQSIISLDARVDWLNFTNINGWTNDVKDKLIYQSVSEVEEGGEDEEWRWCKSMA